MRLAREPAARAPQVPTLQTPTGGVWESNAIARSVARLSDKGLFGASQYEEARSPRAVARALRQPSSHPRAAPDCPSRSPRPATCCARPEQSACISGRGRAGCSAGSL